MTDVTLTFEDADSKLLDIVTVADDVAEESVDDNLVKIINLNLIQDIEAQVFFCHDLKSIFVKKNFGAVN